MDNLLKNNEFDILVPLITSISFGGTKHKGYEVTIFIPDDLVLDVDKVKQFFKEDVVLLFNRIRGTTTQQKLIGTLKDDVVGQYLYEKITQQRQHDSSIPASMVFQCKR